MGLLAIVWVCNVSLKIIMLNYHASDNLPATLLACPKKGGAQEGHPATILIRPARSSSVHFRNSPFEQVKHSGLRQSEMFNPRTRSHDGNVRMGWKSTALRAFTQTPHVPRAALLNFWGTRLGLRQRPAGRRELSEAAGRVFAAERTWP